MQSRTWVTIYSHHTGNSYGSFFDPRGGLRPPRGSKRSVRFAQAQVNEPQPDRMASNRLDSYWPACQCFAQEAPVTVNTDFARVLHFTYLEALRVNKFGDLSGMQPQRGNVQPGGSFHTERFVRSLGPAAGALPLPLCELRSKTDYFAAGATGRTNQPGPPAYIAEAIYSRSCGLLRSSDTAPRCSPPEPWPPIQTRLALAVPATGRPARPGPSRRTGQVDNVRASASWRTALLPTHRQPPLADESLVQCYPCHDNKLLPIVPGSDRSNGGEVIRMDPSGKSSGTESHD